MVTGVPQYDDSVPRHRYYSRYLTHFWVWVETLSLEIKDSMCGFRVYPLGDTLALIDRVNIGRRMDFDTEVAVGLCWRGEIGRASCRERVWGRGAWGSVG